MATTPAKTIELDKNTGAFRYLRDDFNECGQHSIDDPPSEDQDQFQQLFNVLPPRTGTFNRRWGYKSFGSVTDAIRLAAYQNDSQLARRLITLGTSEVAALNEDGTVYRSSVFTPSASARAPWMVVSRNTAYFVDGIEADLQKWDGAATEGLSKWGISAPGSAPTLGVPGAAGAITLDAGRTYLVAFRNSTTGHCSDLSPATASSGPLTAQSQGLSNLAVSADPQVDTKVILATADGGDQTTLYELAILPNSTTSYTDNTDEETLLTANVYLEVDDYGNEHGVSGNTPPPNGDLVLKHKGRLIMVEGQYLRFSKNLNEVTTSTGLICGNYEESWPAEYEIDISEGAETVRGLLSDGETLYIGTERHIRRLLGDSPDNFEKPEIALNEVGVVNQDVWKVVFLEGTPAGAMWLTPDCRVIASDFNTYVDVGHPIQDVLNTINLSAITTSQALYVSLAGFACYVLAVPTGGATVPDKLLVYSMQEKKWYIWTLADSIRALFYNVAATGDNQFLFVAGNGSVYIFDPTSVLDQGTAAIPVTIRTAWLHLGQPALRKLLNELEVMTGDSTLLVLVEAASNDAEFDTPTTVISNATLATSPFGEYKIYLAGSVTNDRFYRLTFTTSASTHNVLDGFSLYVIPAHAL